MRPGDGKGTEKLPTTNSSPLRASSPARGEGRAEGWRGGLEGAPPFSSPAAHFYSLALRAWAWPPLPSVSAEGLRGGERSQRAICLSGPAGRRTRAMDAPSRAPRRGGRARSRALEAGSEGSTGPSPSVRRRELRPLPAASARPSGPGDALALGPPPPPPPAPGPARAGARKER